MKNKQLLFFLAVLIIIFSALPVFGAWVDADGAGRENESVFPNDGASGDPSVVTDSFGYPHIVWFDNTPGNNEIFYIKWNGTSWVDADGAGLESARISYTSNASIFPKIALDSFNYPHIVWQEEYASGNEIFYVKWNGSFWAKADGTAGTDNVSASAKHSSHPRISVDIYDRVHIVWHEGAESEWMTGDFTEINYACWNGLIWADADGAGTESRPVSGTPYYSNFPHIDTDSSGNPHITWADGEEENREIYYIKWNGSAWVDADGAGQESINISNTPDKSDWPDIDIDFSGTAHIVWEDTSFGHQDIFYLKWNGTEWVDADGAGREGIDITYGYHESNVPAVKIDGAGISHVVFSFGTTETKQAYCLKYNPGGNLWTGEDGTAASVNVTDNETCNAWTTFCLDNNGFPCVAWHAGDITEPQDLHYLRWLPEGTPTITPTITITYTAVEDATATLTHTATKTVTQTKTPTITKTLTYTMTPNPMPSATPNGCWADADGTAQESEKVNPGTNSKMALDSSGNPHIVFEDADEIYYLFWNGSAWADADGTGRESSRVSFHVNNSFDPAITVDSSGRPNIAWNGGFNIGWQNVYFLRYNGVSWVDVDGIGVEKISVPAYNGGFPRDVSLALDGAQQPACAWVDYPSGKTYTVKDVFYLKWNTGSWTDADGAGYESSMVSFNTYPCIEPDLKFFGGTVPYIGWIMQAPADNFIIVKKWNLTQWIQADGSTSENTIINNPAVSDARRVKIAVDAAGNPHAVFDAKIGGNREICYLKWNGADWVDYDGAGQESINVSNTPGFSQGASITIDSSGYPHISWFDEGGIYYIRYNGGQFTGADGLPGSKLIAPSSGRETGAVSAAIKPGDVPAVSWHDDIDGQQDVYYLYHICAYNTPTFTATITSTITPSATITLTPVFSATNTVTVTPTITPAPVDLKITKKAYGDNPRPGSKITYEITLENDSYQSIYNPAFWDTLPAQVNYDSTETGPEPAPGNGRYLYWNFGAVEVPPGAEVKLRFTAVISSMGADGIIANTAFADYNDPYYNISKHPAVMSDVSYFPEGKVLVYPNPYNPAYAKDGALKFINLVPGSRVEIYTISGENVTGLFSPGVSVKWNGANRFGKKVSPGIYYYVIINLNSQEKTTGKIFILSNNGGK